MRYMSYPENEMATLTVQSDVLQWNRIHKGSLFLHPDQAAELEAAATAMMNTQSNDSIKFLDDTNQPESRPSSGPAAISSKKGKPRKLWSRAVVSLLGQGRS